MVNTAKKTLDQLNNLQKDALKTTSKRVIKKKTAEAIGDLFGNEMTAGV